MRWVSAFCAGICISATSVMISAFSPALADDYFKGKRISIIVGSGPGGFDYYARLLAHHMGRHIPGKPTIIVQNMPGAGGLLAANHIYNIAAKDGTAIGYVTQNLGVEEALKTDGVRYKTAKLKWIGRISKSTNLTVMWHTSRVKTIKDAMTIKSNLASTGAMSPTTMYPTLVAKVLGAKFNVIKGFKSAVDASLAMERGEVEGTTVAWNTLKTQKPQWLSDKKVNVIVQYALARHSELQDVPTIIDLGRNAKERELLSVFMSGDVIGRSFMLPPEVPNEFVKILRGAFQETLKDPRFLDEIKQANAEFDSPLPGNTLQKMIEKSLQMPEAVLAQAKALRDGMQ
jgi:tripartite-type tricarboxylate transporter receptor subunit TctC